MTEDVTVRRYREGDRNAVWMVHDRAFRASAVEFYPELNRYLRRIPEYFIDPGGEFLVATVPTDPADPPTYGPEDERIVGIGGFVPATGDNASVASTAPVEVDETTVQVRSVRVDPEFQRRGIATTIVRDLESRARERGYRRAVLDTGAGMAAAQSLYENLGYERTGAEQRHGFELVYYQRDFDGDGS